MTFTRIRTINGRRYRYEESRWREGSKVRSRSRSLGPIDAGAGKRKRSWTGLLDFIEAQRLSPEERALASAEREGQRVDQYQREQFGETALERGARERQELLADLHARFGLRLGPADPITIESALALSRDNAKEGPAEGVANSGDIDETYDTGK